VITDVEIAVGIAAILCRAPKNGSDITSFALYGMQIMAFQCNLHPSWLRELEAWIFWAENHAPSECRKAGIEIFAGLIENGNLSRSGHLGIYDIQDQLPCFLRNWMAVDAEILV